MDTASQKSRQIACRRKYVQLTACRRSVTKKAGPKENSKTVFHGTESGEESKQVTNYNVYA